MGPLASSGAAATQTQEAFSVKHRRRGETRLSKIAHLTTSHLADRRSGVDGGRETVFNREYRFKLIENPSRAGTIGAFGRLPPIYKLF